jgi:hypothetical protein
MKTITWNYGGEKIYVQGTWSKGRFFVYDVIDQRGNLDEGQVYDLCEIEDDINSNY